MRSRRFIRLWFAVPLALICLSAVLCAQDTSSLTGTVRDSSGAIVPGASVSVSNPAQNLTRSTSTNSAGDFLVAGLTAGTYNLTISVAGFKQYQATGIVLRAAQNARADATLQVGAATTEVTVQGVNVGQVETQTSELSGTVTGKQISQLELNGRNFTQLVTLVPGVSNQTGQDEGTVGVYGNISFSVNGGRVEYNNWEVDGGDNMDNGSNDTLNVYPNVDAIAEVKVLTSNYGAQYGRNGSGTVETITKSGTQNFHGDAFEFVRNDVFNARNFFDYPNRSPYKKNDFGYTIGGPFFIPNHYNTDKTKTFFFFSEEWRRERDPNTFANLQVPSNQERAGNFSDVCPGADCPIDPTTGQPFAGNQVTVDPNAQDLLTALFPAPNSGSGAQSLYNASFSTPTTWREELVRVDQNISPKLRTFVHYIHDSWSTVVPTSLWPVGAAEFPTVQTNFVGPGTSLVAHLTANASPTLLNEFVFSYTADHIFLSTIGNVARPANFTVGGIFSNGFGGKLPAVSICCNPEFGGGLSEDDGYYPWNNANPTYTFRDSVTRIVGGHNLQMGAYAVIAQKNEDNSADTQGTLNFTSGSPVSTGNGFADFLLGRASSYSQTNLITKYYNRYKILEPYFQDDWRVNPHLTLNLGLRVSLFGTYREKYKQAYNFEAGVYNPATAPQIDVTGNITGQTGALVPGTYNLSALDGIVQCGAAGVPAGCVQGHLFNPAPRVGFAWDPKGDGKTAVRGGYGIFFEHTNGNEGNTESLEGSVPLVLSPTQFNIVGYNNVGTTGGAPLLFPLGVTAIPTRARWPYVQQWNLNVQREVLPNTVVSVAYVGSKGTHLTLLTDLNQLPVVPASQNPFQPGQVITSDICNTGVVNGQPVTGQAAVNLGVACGNDPNPNRPFLGYGGITHLETQANSTYNALQVSARHTTGHFNFTLAYTYSHAIDDSSDRYDTNFVDSYNVARSRSSSNFDQRHILTLGYVWDLPYYAGPGWKRGVLGGWQLSGITTAQTGTPFSIVNGLSFADNAGVANGAGSSSFADIIGNINAAPPSTNVPNFNGPLLYNPAAFAQPQGLTFGNAGRNILYNPSRLNFDAGLFKHVPIRERASLELRVEAFNVFNHTQWNGINNGFSCVGADNSAGNQSCFGSTNFLIPSGAHNPRILQFGMKFIF